MVNVTSETSMHFIIEKFALGFMSHIQLPPVLTQEFKFKNFLSKLNS